jgi:GMP synthase (glutamine-hydrolysing)
MKTFQILIIDLGSQYTLVIGRTLRELGFRSLILHPDKVLPWLENNSPKTIILSGGSGSVEDPHCLVPPKEILHLGIPVLGICLGMQWITKELGGKVTSAFLINKEYGPVQIEFEPKRIFDGISDNRTIVWASHGDCIETPPEGFKIIARSHDYHTTAAISNKDESIVGLQFHPEVTDSYDGKKILLNFLTNCKCVLDWHPHDAVKHIREEVRHAASIQSEHGTVIGKAILGLSGGVDSSVTAKLLMPVFEENLLCIVIDSGFLREGEIDEIKETAKELMVSYKIIDAVDRFQYELAGTIDPEVKRKVFKKMYQVILEEEAKSFGANFMIQGSLATDFIESGKAGESALIKSHHNIGIDWALQEIHPLRSFFKYEVREIGDLLKLPTSITQRQPFPGPGLMVRVIGIPPTQEVVSILRTCDAWIREILEDHGIYDKISQLVVALDGTKTVGVKGDGRAYGYSIILRPVVTHDFMTCSVYEIPFKILTEIMSKVTQHPAITRLFYDVTTKPPGTTEME